MQSKTCPLAIYAEYVATSNDCLHSNLPLPIVQSSSVHTRKMVPIGVIFLPLTALENIEFNDCARD